MISQWKTLSRISHIELCKYNRTKYIVFQHTRNFTETMQRSCVVGSNPPSVHSGSTKSNGSVDQQQQGEYWLVFGTIAIFYQLCLAAKRVDQHYCIIASSVVARAADHRHEVPVVPLSLLLPRSLCDLPFPLLCVIIASHRSAIMVLSQIRMIESYTRSRCCNAIRRRFSCAGYLQELPFVTLFK